MNFELNFEQLQKKLKKVLNPSRFRFVVILYPNTNMIDEIKEHISSIYSDSSKTSLDLKDKSYQEIAPELYKNNEGFVYINDFDEILNNPDLYNGFNQRRDKIASFNINLICFISLYQKDELFTKAINVIPDLWEFKNTVLELEKDIDADKLSNITISENHTYSSIGGLTTKDKELELENLLERLKSTDNDELKLNILEQISTVYSDIGSFKEALHYRELILEIEKHINNNLNLAKSYNNISVTYIELGELDKALEFQTKSLSIKEKIKNISKNKLIESYNNLSQIYMEKGNFEEALSFQNKVLSYEKELQETDNSILSTCYNNLSSIYRRMKNLAKSLEFQKKSLNIDEKILDKKHPALASNYNNLSLIYHDMGDFKIALKFQMIALLIREEILGDTHPDLANSYNNISLIYQDLKECNKAKEYLEKSLKILEQLNYTHPKYLLTKNNLKIINAKIKKQQKAGYKQKGKYCKDM